MNRPAEPPPTAGRASERGGARLNFLLAMAVIAALAYVGYQFVPAAYHAWAFERFMQDTVNTAITTGKTPTWVEQQIRRNFEDHGVPTDADVKVAREANRITASVRYTLPVSLLVTELDYDFDVTVRSVALAGGP
jgi:hypothetical protein